MQKVLTFVYNKKKYVSNPWRFSAAVMVQREYLKLKENEIIDPIQICSEAVDYLFEGTEATADILESAVSSKMRMCREVMKWFMDDFTGKNEESLTEGQAEEAEN